MPRQRYERQSDAGLLASASMRTEHLSGPLVDVYRPLHRAFMLTATAYYSYVTIAHFIDITGLALAVLVSISAVTALMALLVWRIVEVRRVSVLGIELLNGSVQALMLINVVAYQLAHFEPAKLVYFPLLAIAFAMSSITNRAVLSSVAAALVSMLLVVAANPAEPLAPYIFLSVGTAVTAIGLSTFLRGVIVREVNARLRSEAAEAEARHLANVDFLTNLPNRRQFMSMLNELTERQQPFVVGILDLDGFKGINDAFGHSAGDQALAEVSRRLTDLMAHRATVARIGGDEFALLAPGQWTAEDLTESATSLLRELRRPLRLESSVVNLSGSLGLATSRQGETSDAALDRADYAAHEAKHHHKGDVVVYSSAHDERVLAERNLDRELLRPEFSLAIEPVFQMIVDGHSGRPVGFEALARWRSPVLGDVPPSRFIPAAERLNLVPQITRTMVLHALAFAAQLPRGIRVSVNLSPQDLSSNESMRQIAKLLDTSRLRPCPIDFEITETAIVSDIGEATEALLMVMAHGSRVSLDDFGTGHSSLSLVQQLPLDRIKIDRSFVADIGSSQTNRAIVKTTLDLCHNLGVSCVVEGVETAAQVEALQGLGARLFQGYHFSRPLPPDAALAAFETLQRAA